jgi:hypothetical protein
VAIQLLITQHISSSASVPEYRSSGGAVGGCGLSSRMEPQAHAARHGTVMRATDTRRSMRASNRGWLLLLPALAMLVMAARAQEFVEGAVTTVAGNDAAFAYSIDGVGTEASFAVPTVRSVPLTRLLATLVSANLRGGELRSHWGG